MFSFHADRKRYFDVQYFNARNHVIPFIEQHFPVTEDKWVMDIGCGEGGVLKAFMERGCTCVGVEMEAGRVHTGMQWLQQELETKRLSFILEDIRHPDIQAKYKNAFDIIILKDVIEHIHDQASFLELLRGWLRPGGVVFLGFPPWQMPFGGHQQMCRSKVLSKLPWFHLLPRPVYRGVLKTFKEPVDELMEIRDTRLSIERFEKICRTKHFAILKRDFFLLNPIYEWKFGWKPRRQFKLIRKIPVVRNFVTTCMYYLIKDSAN